MEPEESLPILQELFIVPVLSQTSPVHITPSSSIIFCYVLVACFLLPFSPTFMHLSSPPCLLIPLSISSNSNSVYRRIQVMKVFIMQFSQPSQHYIPLCAIYPLLQSVLKHLFPLLTETNFHTHISVQKKSQFNIFQFLRLQTENRRQIIRTGWQKALPDLNIVNIIF